MLASLSTRYHMASSGLGCFRLPGRSSMISSFSLLPTKCSQLQDLKFSSFSWNFSRAKNNSSLRSPIGPSLRRFATEATAPAVEASNTPALETPIVEVPQTPEQLELEAAMRDPAPKFAVVQVGGHQYKVTSGDLILVSKMEAPVGSRIALKKVLLAGSQRNTVIGMPLVQQARVEALVEQHVLTDKMYVFKKRRRKNSQRTRGVRHPVTQLRIMKVDVAVEGF